MYFGVRYYYENFKNARPFHHLAYGRFSPSFPGSGDLERWSYACFKMLAILMVFDGKGPIWCKADTLGLCEDSTPICGQVDMVSYPWLDFFWVGSCRLLVSTSLNCTTDTCTLETFWYFSGPYGSKISRVAVSDTCLDQVMHGTVR